MSNLAYQTKRQRIPTKQPKQKVVIKKRATITMGEKVLIVLFVLALLSTSIFIISKAFATYKTNIEVQKLEEKISSKDNEIDDLKKEATDLSRPERVMDIAKKHGLNLNKKVKNIRE